VLTHHDARVVSGAPLDAPPPAASPPNWSPEAAPLPADPAAAAAAPLPAAALACDAAGWRPQPTTAPRLAVKIATAAVATDRRMRAVRARRGEAVVVGMADILSGRPQRPVNRT
jgi:hypothetical protein